MYNRIVLLKRLLGKNRYAYCKNKYFSKTADKNKVNLNFWVNENDKRHNIGDWLSKIIVENTANLYGIDINKKVSKTKHLYAIGSILLGYNDATVWGSGFIREENNHTKIKGILHKLSHKTDVRAVRGPETKRTLDSWGIECPEVYGDPGILLPKFYTPKPKSSEKFLVVPHHTEIDQYANNYPTLSPLTDNWQDTIDKLCSAEFIICSSLHALILAEAYEIPAILLKTDITNNNFKFNDYYYSTKRFDYVTASSVEEALKIKPVLPDKTIFAQMQQKLLDVFPFDLWE